MTCSAWKAKIWIHKQMSVDFFCCCLFFLYVLFIVLRQVLRAQNKSFSVCVTIPKVGLLVVTMHENKKGEKLQYTWLNQVLFPLRS